MNLFSLLPAVLLVSTLTLEAKTTSDTKNASGYELCFTENKGQVHDQHFALRPDVLFSGQAGSLAFHLKHDGISYQLYSFEEVKNTNKNSVVNKTTEIVKQIQRVDIHWPGCNINSEVVTDENVPGFSHYFNEACPNGVMQVRSFTGVRFKSLYPGIDLHYYAKQGALKYDYLVEAGADYRAIQLQIEGATSVKVTAAGQLMIKSPLGDVYEQAPYAYQGKRLLASRWIILNEKTNLVGFVLEQVNATEALVIDPVVRAWGTYYGGNSTDYGNYVCTDVNGNVYMSGSTNSVGGNAIATSGSHQLIFASGYTLGANNSDAFLVKFNSIGVRQWATYYGSAGIEYGGAVACDAAGNVYFTGSSTSFGTIAGTAIATSFAYQSGNAGQDDAFLVKFNSNGVRQWATYYGGPGSEGGSICMVDASGSIYLGGTTTTSTGIGIASAGGHQPNYGGNSSDAYLAKFNSSGSRLWGTYYGGSGIEYGFGGAVDVNGDVYMCGYVNSNQGYIISTVGSHQPSFAGSYDAYLVKFNSAGVRQWGTYYGGGGEEIAFGCATDPSGNVYLGGNTNTGSANVISTFGSHQPNYASSLYDDGFLVKFNSAGVRQWGTYYGGTQAESSCKAVCDLVGNVYLVGSTASTGNAIISTNGSHQAGFGGGQFDAFLAKFNGNGVRQWGTYYGGNQTDNGGTAACDNSNNIYLIGSSSTTGGSSIASTGSHQYNSGSGGSDAFMVKLVDCPYFPPTNTTPLSDMEICENESAVLTATASGNILWFETPLGTLSAGTGPSFTTGTLTPGVHTFYAESQYCVQGTNRTAITVSVNPLPVLNVTTSNPILCEGYSSTLTVSGASTYTWSQGGFSNSSVVSPTATTVYTVNGVDGYGCVNTVTFTQVVDACVGLEQFINDSRIKLFPNPTKNRCILSVPDQLEHRFSMYNILGKCILEGQFYGQTELQTEELAAGVYCIVLDGEQCFKLIKE